MTIAIIPAAGNGIRLQKNMPKALVNLGRYPMIVYSLYAFATHPAIDSIIVCIPSDSADDFQPIILRITELFPHIKISTTPGGKERGDSIAAALAIIPQLESQQIIIHDAARPFTPRTVIEATIKALTQNIAATVPILPVIDTIKLCQADGTIESTLPRERLVRAQTPQGFQGMVLHNAYQSLNPANFTDDASMVENMGITVQTIPGSELSRKITTPADLIWAEHYVRENNIYLY